MEKYFIRKETLTGISDTIRTVMGTTGPINPTEISLKIESIAAGGGGATPPLRKS